MLVPGFHALTNRFVEVLEQPQEVGHLRGPGGGLEGKTVAEVLKDFADRTARIIRYDLEILRQKVLVEDLQGGRITTKETADQKADRSGVNPDVKGLS